MSPVQVRGDHELPTEVQVVNAEVARVGGRLHPYSPLCYFDESQRCYPLLLQVFDPEDRELLDHDAMVADVSCRGLGLRVCCPLEAGQRVILRAYSLESGQLLFSEQLLIRHHRCRPDQPPGQGESRQYEATTLSESTSPLYRSILDTVLLAANKPEEDRS